MAAVTPRDDLVREMIMSKSFQAPAVLRLGSARQLTRGIVGTFVELAGQRQPNP